MTYVFKAWGVESRRMDIRGSQKASVLTILRFSKGIKKFKLYCVQVTKRSPKYDVFFNHAFFFLWFYKLRWVTGQVEELTIHLKSLCEVERNFIILVIYDFLYLFHDALDIVNFYALMIVSLDFRHNFYGVNFSTYEWSYLLHLFACIWV